MDHVYQSPDKPLPTKKASSKSSSGNLVTVISAAIFVLLSFGVIIFLYNQNQNLKKQLSDYQIATPEAPTNPSPTPVSSLESPIVSSLSANSMVKSPLKVEGTVPAGWMFEGVFPIILLDSEKNVITQTSAEEVTPGSWQLGTPVEFTATLTFKNSSASGILVLENDNPSGNPASAKTFEIPIKFQ